MSLKKIFKLVLLHRCISMEQTGNSQLLSKQLGISRTYLFEMIDVLKKWGEVVFDYKRKTYKYNNDFDFKIIVTADDCKVLSYKDLEKIIGGIATFLVVRKCEQHRGYICF